MLGLRTSARIALTVGLLGGSVEPARADGGRLAVLIVADRDPELSDNLTEVAISKLAEQREHRLVGWRELRDQLSDIVGGGGIGDCLVQAQCLVRIGAAADVDTALIGDVRRQDDRFTVHLVLVNTLTAVRAADFSESVGLDVAQLIASVRRGAGIVSAPKPRLTLQPEHPALLQVGGRGARAQTISGQQQSTPRARWVVPLGYSAGGAAVVSLSAAVVTGSIASAKPSGTTRAEVQSDLERRDRYAGVANSLYLVGGALALGAAILLVSHLRRP